MFTMKIVLNDILFICAVVKISATQPSTDTQAGYTKDPDTCKKYNENLQKMWATLAKYINSKDPLNEQALHNIAIMLGAYLDHQNKEKHEEEVFRADDTTIAERKNDNVRGVLKNIKNLLSTDDAITKIKEMVLVNFKPSYEEQDPGCKQINEDNLFSSIALSYKIYLDNAKCRGYDDPGFLREKAQLRIGRQPNSKLISSQRVHDFYDDVDEGIIDEAESTDQFHGDLIPVVNYPRSPGRLNQRTNTRRSLQRVFGLLNGRSLPSTLDDKSKTAVKTNTQSRNKINVRTDEFCIKYANRKFFKTLRAIIERFFDLHDCVHDYTLRMSNKTRKTPRGFRYTQPMLRVSDNDIRLMASIRPGQQQQIRINNYGNKLKEFKRQEAPKTIFAVLLPVLPAYTRPLLLQLRNRLGNLIPPLPYYSSQNIKQQIKYPFDYIVLSGYNLDNNYKSFLYRPDATSQTTNKILKTQCASNGINNENNIQNYKNGQNANSWINRQGKNSRCSHTLEIKSDRNAPLNTNNVVSKDLLQDTLGVNTANKVLTELQNSSLQNTQLDVNNIALSNEKGYVELSYLVKYPKSIVYRPQYLVKNILSYDDFIKAASRLDVNDKDKQLLKVTQFLPDISTQVLFENQEMKSPLAIHDIINKASNEANKSSLIGRTIGNIKNKNHAHSIFKLIEKDKTNSIIGHADSLREDKIIITVNPVPLQEHKIQTDVKQTYSNVNDEIQTNTEHAESSKDFKISSNVNPTDYSQKEKVETDFKQADFNLKDKINIEPNPADSLLEDKVETDLKQTYFKLQDEVNSNTYPASPLGRDKMATHVNSTDFLQEDEIETDFKEADFNLRDKSNSDTYPASPFRKDKMTINVIPADYLQEDRVETDLNQEYFNLQDESNSNTYPASPFRRNKLTTTPNLTNSWLADKVETDLKHTNFKLQDEINSDTHLDSPLRKDAMTINVNRADSLQADVNLKDDINDDTHPASPFRRNDMTINFNAAESLQEDKVITDEQQANLTLNYKTDISMDPVDHVREDKVTINVNPIDSLQVDKDMTYIEQTYSTTVRDIETNIDHADFLRENKMTTNVDPASYLQKDKDETDDELAVLPQNGKFDNDEDHADFLRDDKLITNINPADSLIEERFQTDVEQAHSISKDFYLHSKFQKVNNDINQAGSLAQDKVIRNVNTTHSWQKAKVETDVVQENSTRKDKIETDIGHADSLRQNKKITNFNSTGSSQEYEVKPNIAKADSIRRDRLETDVDHQDPLRQNKNIPNYIRVVTLHNDKVETSLDQTHSIRKDFINSDTVYAESLRDVEIVTSIPTDALQRDKIQIDAVQTDSSRKNKIDSKDKTAAIVGNFQKTYKNGNDAYDIDPRIENNNKAVVYFRTEDETVKSQSRNQIEIKQINPTAKSELSTDVNNARPLQKRITTNFNFDPLSVTNENGDQVGIEAASMRYDINNAKTTLNTASEAYMKLKTYKAESSALTLRSLCDKWKDKLNSTFQVQRNNQVVKTLEIHNNT